MIWYVSQCCIILLCYDESYDFTFDSFVGRSEIDLPVSTVAVFLQKLENFCLWNKFMTVSSFVVCYSYYHCYDQCSTL